MLRRLFRFYRRIPLALSLCIICGFFSFLSRLAFAQSSPPASQEVLHGIQQAAAAADAFRLLATRQPSDAFAAYGIEAAPQKWARDVEPRFRADPGQLAQFFAYALIAVGRFESPRCVVLFYNPWMDGALLTAWRERPADGWKITDLLLLTGETLRGETLIQGSASPRWLKSDMPMAKAVVEVCQKSIAAFQQRFPIVGQFQFPVLESPVKPETELDALAARMRFNLAFFDARIGAARKTVEEAVQKTLLVLSGGSKDALLALTAQDQDPYVAETLCLLPAEVRRDLLPHWYVAQGEKAVVVLSSARFPRWFILLFLDLAQSQQKIRALGLYDFEVMTGAQAARP